MHRCPCAWLCSTHIITLYDTYMYMYMYNYDYCHNNAHAFDIHCHFAQGFHEARVILVQFPLPSASVKMPFPQTVVSDCERVFRVALQTGKCLKCVFLHACDYIIQKCTRRTHNQQRNDIKPTGSSQSFDAVSISSENNIEDSYDSHEEDQEEPSILATFRDIWIVFDQIISELSSRSVLNLAITDSRMYVALSPVLEKRKAAFWTLLRTPRQHPQSDTLRAVLLSERTQAEHVSSLRKWSTICVSGCCSPFTHYIVFQNQLRRLQKTLRLGDFVYFIFQLDQASYLKHAVIILQAFESVICQGHPLELRQKQINII